MVAEGIIMTIDEIRSALVDYGVSCAQIHARPGELKSFGVSIWNRLALAGFVCEGYFYNNELTVHMYLCDKGGVIEDMSAFHEDVDKFAEALVDKHLGRD